MRKIIKRLLQLPDLKQTSVFLWGSRKVGKSWYIRNELGQDHIYVDLLKSDSFSDYSTNPKLLREKYQFLSQPKPIVIDEIQKCPDLLDEVHWLMENANRTFLLTGSSARKLRKQHANLLGGRAWRREMRPLCYPEIENFDLESALNSGFIPQHFLSNEPKEYLRAYVADYLKEEIAQEALVRNLPAFANFLQTVAITNSELLNYSNVAREVGVSAKVVREYFQILEDTLLGFRIQPWSKSKNRRLVETDKFYLFDVGLALFLSKRQVSKGTPEFGKSFEHYILMELLAYQAYKNPELEIKFWRTSNKQEVDFILNDKSLVIEIKSSSKINDNDLKYLSLIAEDGHIKERILVCMVDDQRIMSDRFGKITILPWRDFLGKLWSVGYEL